MEHNWERAEERVKTLIKGWRTPGSGNQRIKGDVRNKTWVWEVKQTSQLVFTLYHTWLQELEEIHLSEGKEVGFALFFNLHPFYFVLDEYQSVEQPWKTLNIVEQKVPAEIVTSKGIWRRVTESELKENYL
jgi:hypothetical protein